MNESSRFDTKRKIDQLGYSGDVKNAKELCQYLNSADPEIVSIAAFFIGYLKARNHIDDLVVLLSHDDQRIVNMAGAGLSEMVDSRDERILPELYKVLNHSYLLARLSAIEAIGQIGSKSSMARLVEMFELSSSGQKARIVVALGNIGSPDALPLLESYLDQVKKMDHSIPNRGGTRGVDLHPDALEVVTEEAISSIKHRGA